MTLRSLMLPALSTALIWLGLAMAAHAQPWEARTFENGSLIFGSAVAPGGTLSFGCTAPSPQGRPLIETGSHESHRSDPFEAIMTFSDDLFDWQPPYRLDNVALYVGETGYRLPSVGLNELQGTAVYLPMTDPMLQAVGDGASLVLDTGQGTAYRYPVEGLSAALDRAFSVCVARWAQMGIAVPPALVPLAAPSMPASVPVAPRDAASSALPPAVVAHVRSGCSGPFTQTRAARMADFDRDGLPDYILHWGDITCSGAMARPFCGAANCSIDVMLSSRGYARGGELLGLGVEIVQVTPDLPGLMLSATPFLCADGFCDRPFYWNGTQLTQ